MDMADKLKRLEATDDDFERNQLAIDLADDRYTDALPALIRLIQRPDLENRRGTLVYCLESFDCRPHLELLIDLLIKGNFEVAMHADMAITALGDISGDDVMQGYKRLLQALKSSNLEDWRQESFMETLKRFD